MAYKLDLHTHSTLSHDGGIPLESYKKILESGLLNYVAVTDHNEIDLALALHQELGEQIIVGEEIKTTAGEVIGLFLKKKISPEQELGETIEQIKGQGGLVYIPHPFDIRRKGIPKKILEELIQLVDIIEVFNARNIMPNGNNTVVDFNEKHSKPFAASSDAHSLGEIGRTYTLTAEAPTVSNLLEQLTNPELVLRSVSLWGFLGPKRNKIIKLFRK